MANVQDAVASASRDLIGVRFRPQGRDPQYGLDCVGVVAAALAAAGRPTSVPCDYAQRGGDPRRIASRIDEASLLRRIDPAMAGPGDILLMQPGEAQSHLGVMTASGLVHADAGLRRVVETPGSLRWPVIAAWRVVGEG